jgi:hypothetical protein
MRRIATYLRALSNDRDPIAILAVMTIVVNLIVVVGFTNYYSLTLFVNHSTKSANTPLIRTRQVSIDGRQYEIGSGSAEEDLTDQEILQSCCFDHDSHSRASRNHPPSLTHYLKS